MVSIEESNIFIYLPPKNRRNGSGILSTSRSSPGPSVTAASPGFSQNGTTISPRTATRSSQGSSLPRPHHREPALNGLQGEMIGGGQFQIVPVRAGHPLIQSGR